MQRSSCDVACWLCAVVVWTGRSDFVIGDMGLSVHEHYTAILFSFFYQGCGFLSACDLYRMIFLCQDVSF